MARARSAHTPIEVMEMGTGKYDGLGDLLKDDERALRFFEALPLRVRERIAPHCGNIDSFETLRDYADIYFGDD